jgi:antitoxin ParD1/3/4
MRRIILAFHRINSMFQGAHPTGSDMATVRKTITLTDQQDGWIKAQIQSGHYTNDSEYIHDLIRREQECVTQLEAVRSALIEGENSGTPQVFDAQAFKQRMRAMHG